MRKALTKNANFAEILAFAEIEVDDEENCC
jgi:hypothetical protein